MSEKGKASDARELLEWKRFARWQQVLSEKGYTDGDKMRAALALAVLLGGRCRSDHEKEKVSFGRS